LRTVKTNISWGYLPLIEIFAKANSLVLKFESRVEPPRQLMTICYEDDSDTNMTITFMSIRHLGFENMLCDYLIKCGIDPRMIPTGGTVMRKSDEQMEKDWQEHRKKIGLR
jgi:hypothetical protein